MSSKVKSAANKKSKSISYNGGNIRTTEWNTFQADVRVGGTRKRKQFGSLDQAKEFIDDAVGEGSRIGTEVFAKLTAKQAQEAVEAYALLEQAGCSDSLTSIASEHVERNAGAVSEFTIRELFDAHLEDLKARRRRRTWMDKENRLKGLLELHGDVSLSRITFADVTGWLKNTGHQGRTLRNDQIAVQSFFNWCDKHTARLALQRQQPQLHWRNEVAVFPAEEWATSDRPEIGTVSNEDALAVLRRMEELDPPCALVLAIGLLAGLRTAEIVEKDGLLWENIDLAERELTVTPKQSKTKHGRTISIHPTLLLWLVKYKQESGRVGRRWNSFNKRRREACKELNLAWPPNAARHTFASNYCKLEGERSASDALGHTGSVEMLLDHYRGVMQTKARARAYFEILTPAGQ